MTQKMIRVRTSVSTISRRQPEGAVVWSRVRQCTGGSTAGGASGAGAADRDAGAGRPRRRPRRLAAGPALCYTPGGPPADTRVRADAPIPGRRAGSAARSAIRGPSREWRTPRPDERRHAPVDHPAGRHHRRAVRPLPRPRRPVARHRDEGDGRRRRDDLRGRGRLHPAPVHDDRHPRRRRRGRDRRRHHASSRRRTSPTPTIFGLDLGWRTGLAFLVGAACSMASGIIGMYISVKVERPDGRGRPAQPRRGGPGRDARRRRLGLPRRRPVAARRLRHLHASSAASAAARRRTTRRS